MQQEWIRNHRGLQLCLIFTFLAASFVLSIGQEQVTTTDLGRMAKADKSPTVRRGTSDLHGQMLAGKNLKRLS